MSLNLWPHGLVAHQPPLSSGFPRQEWVAISLSRGSSQSRDQICVSCIGRWIFHHWATKEALLSITLAWKMCPPLTFPQNNCPRIQGPGDKLKLKCGVGGLHGRPRPAPALAAGSLTGCVVDETSSLVSTQMWYWWPGVFKVLLLF